MLPRIKDLILRTRSFVVAPGVVALSAVAALSFPVAASAAPATVTYNNSATASSQTNGKNVFVLKYQAEETATSTLNAKNQALASTSHCANCAASGVAFAAAFTAAHLLGSASPPNFATAASCPPS